MRPPTQPLVLRAPRILQNASPERKRAPGGLPKQNPEGSGRGRRPVRARKTRRGSSIATSPPTRT
jgi:hypothetical protein